MPIERDDIASGEFRGRSLFFREALRYIRLLDADGLLYRDRKARRRAVKYLVQLQEDSLQKAVHEATSRDETPFTPRDLCKVRLGHLEWMRIRAGVERLVVTEIAAILERRWRATVAKMRADAGEAATSVKVIEAERAILLAAFERMVSLPAETRVFPPADASHEYRRGFEEGQRVHGEATAAVLKAVRLESLREAGLGGKGEVA